MGITCAAVLVDHVRNHNGDRVLFWRRDLWQSSCKWHHDTVKRKLEELFDQGMITVKQLWLNSKFAVDLATSLLGTRP